jgi:hypothetical protein
MLKEDNAALRAQAAVSLGGIGHDARTATPKLAERLKDPDAKVRKSAPGRPWPHMATFLGAWPYAEFAQPLSAR